MDKLQQIKSPINTEFEAFKQKFDSSLQSSNLLLNEVLSHIKQRRGKMMRPILSILFAKLFGEVNEATYHAAISLELLHTASLIHDDVVDASDKRRGQASVNAIFDNKLSVLAGDYLLATSLKHSALTGKLPLVNLVSDLGQMLSVGEIIQLTNISATDFSEEVYYDVIRKKTAALFAVAAKAGALSVDSSDEYAEKAYTFGEMIGIAFQIKDDIFDYLSSDEIGKPTGHDMQEGKLTLPALYVLNQSNDEALIQLALKIRALEATNDEIAYFTNIVKERGGIEYAYKVMADYNDKALSILSEFSSGEVQDSLKTYVDYVVARNK